MSRSPLLPGIPAGVSVPAPVHEIPAAALVRPRLQSVASSMAPLFASELAVTIHIVPLEHLGSVVASARFSSRNAFLPVDSAVSIGIEPFERALAAPLPHGAPLLLAEASVSIAIELLQNLFPVLVVSCSRQPPERNHPHNQRSPDSSHRVLPLPPTG